MGFQIVHNNNNDDMTKLKGIFMFYRYNMCLFNEREERVNA